MIINTYKYIHASAIDSNLEIQSINLYICFISLPNWSALSARAETSHP